MEFADACMSGNLEKAKRYYNDTNYKQTELYMGLYNWSFCKAIQHRQLEVAKWLVQVEPDLNITAEFDGYDAFLWACRNNHLVVAQWLVQIKPELISLYTNSELNMSSKFVAIPWMLQINPDMEVVSSAQINFAFRVACSFKSLDVAKWLHKEVYKEVKWNQRKLLLASHLQGYPTELLYSLPHDLIRNISNYI
jgi:hypothetical protein